MTTTTCITRGEDWSENKYDDDRYGDVPPGTGNRILSRAVEIFDERTGLSWSPHTGEVIGPVDYDPEPHIDLAAVCGESWDPAYPDIDLGAVLAAVRDEALNQAWEEFDAKNHPTNYRGDIYQTHDDWGDTIYATEEGMEEVIRQLQQVFYPDDSDPDSREKLSLEDCDRWVWDGDEGRWYNWQSPDDKQLFEDEPDREGWFRVLDIYEDE